MINTKLDEGQIPTSATNDVLDNLNIIKEAHTTQIDILKSMLAYAKQSLIDINRQKQIYAEQLNINPDINKQMDVGLIHKHKTETLQPDVVLMPTSDDVVENDLLIIQQTHQAEVQLLKSLLTRVEKVLIDTNAHKIAYEKQLSINKEILIIQESHKTEVSILKSLIEHLETALIAINYKKKASEQELSIKIEQNKEISDTLAQTRSELEATHNVLQTYKNAIHPFSKKLTDEFEDMKLEYGDPDTYVKDIIGENSHM